MATTTQYLYHIIVVSLLTFISFKRCTCISGVERMEHIQYFEPVQYDVNELLHLHHVTKRSTSQPIKFKFTAFERQFPLHLKHDRSVHHPSLVVETDQGRHLYDSSNIYHGHVIDEPSRIHGLITKEGRFEGTIYLTKETYFIEPSNHHFSGNPEFHTIIYRLSDVTFNSSSSTCAHDKLYRKQLELYKRNVTSSEYDDATKTSEDMETKWQQRYGEKLYNDQYAADEKTFHHKRNKRAIDPNKVTCKLYLQADHLFYQKYGSDVDAVIAKLTQYVEAVNDIYTNIDFDGSGSPDNIGFVVKKIKVYTDPAAVGYKYPGNYAVEYLLDRHSQDNYDAYCLAYLFTNRDFDDGVLGLAWIAELTALGGVCEKYATLASGAKSLNTGIVTEINYGSSVPSAVSFATFAHEIGHNFGSEHDPDVDSNCTPGGNAGNYIMSVRATSGLKSNNYKLSSCSIAAIQIIIENKARADDGCFVQFKDEVCGNRLVEGTEECDCGWEDDCTEGCCNPQVMDPSAPGVETPCTRKSTALCSPSQGPCCTTACQYANNTVSCRTASACLGSTTCSGSSFDCPDSSQKPNQTECGDDNDFQVCYNGECTGSICLAYGRESCQCEPEVPGNWMDTKLCQVCCMDGNECKSSFDLADIPDKDVASGTPCLDFQGYCDVFKKCRQVDPSGPLSSLRNLLTPGSALNTLKDFLTKHWYIGIIGGLALVICIALVVKFCSNSRKDQTDLDRPRGNRTSRDRNQQSRSTHMFERSKLGSRNQVEPSQWM